MNFIEVTIDIEDTKDHELGIKGRVQKAECMIDLDEISMIFPDLDDDDVRCGTNIRFRCGDRTFVHDDYDYIKLRLKELEAIKRDKEVVI